MPKYSERISEILEFFRDSQTLLSIARADEFEADNLTQDKLHALELQDLKYHERAAISKELTAIRKRRRAAKDAQKVLDPICVYTTQNAGAIKAMERLLGELRGVEAKLEGRVYVKREDGKVMGGRKDG